MAQPQAQEGLPRTREELDDFVRAAVRPHLVRPDTDAPGRVARVDEAASSLMSSLLHDPAFQEVESLWRSLVFLLSRVDTYGKVRVYAVHLPREELDRDLTGPAGHPGSRLHGLLARPDLGAPARRWSLAVGAYTFGAGPRDLELLARIAAVARATGIPWVSSFHAAPSGPGSEPGPGAFPEEWAAFRRRPEASWLGLTYPRFLVREPFGAARRSSRPFDFQEGVSSREDLLWGHGAFLCAALMGQGYAARGWGFRAEDWLEMEGMPQASPGVGGESTPLSTEATLDLGMANRLMEAGIITLLPFPTRAAVRLGGIPSVSAGGAPLSGWWRR